MRRLRLLTEAISLGAALGIREPGAKNKLLHLGILPIAKDSGKSIYLINILRQLLRAGKMSPDVRDMYGHTPAHIAALEDFLQAAEIPVEHKAMLEELDRLRRPPLMIASKFENSGVSLALIDPAARIDESKVDIDKILLAGIGIRNTKAWASYLARELIVCHKPTRYWMITDLIAELVGGLDSLKIL